MSAPLFLVVGDELGDQLTAQEFRELAAATLNTRFGSLELLSVSVDAFVGNWITTAGRLHAAYRESRRTGNSALNQTVIEMLGEGELYYDPIEGLILPGGIPALEDKIDNTFHLQVSDVLDLDDGGDEEFELDHKLLTGLAALSLVEFGIDNIRYVAGILLHERTYADERTPTVLEAIDNTQRRPGFPYVIKAFVVLPGGGIRVEEVMPANSGGS